MRLKGGVLLVITCLLFIRLVAQSNQYLFSHIDVTDGLSNNHINSIYKDSRGFMWFGTISGVNRYDGYRFKIFKHNPRDTNSLIDNYVDHIFEDFNGKLWLQTRAGFNIYDPLTIRIDRNPAAYLRKFGLPETGLSDILTTNNSYWLVYTSLGLVRYKGGSFITLQHNPRNNQSLDAAPIAQAKADSQGNIWVLHVNALLEKVDAHTNRVVYRTTLVLNKPDIDFTKCTLVIDGQNDMWLYSDGGFKGVYYFTPGSGKVKLLSEESAQGRLSSSLVYGIVQDEHGLIWIGTDHGGINIIDKKDFSVKVISNIIDNERSIAENSVGPLYKDNLGIIWLGTFKKGINYYQENSIRFPLYSHQASNPASLDYDDINSFVEDAAGNTWIGTNGGGLVYFNRKENTFRLFKHQPGNANSLSNDVIVNMCLDYKNRLWIGTYYGGLDCYDGKTFVHYRHNDRIPSSLSDDRVMAIYEDAAHDLWVGTLAGGLNKLDKATNGFYHYTFQQNDTNSIPNNYIAAITEDAQKNLWVGTAYGIGVMEKSTGRFRRYLSADSKLSNDNIVSLLKDSRGNMWVGTREGLSVWNPDKKTFQSFRMEEGLPDNTIRSIQEDDQQNIWVSTSNGLSKISLKTGPRGYQISCKNYDELDGLQGREFNNNAGLKIKTGELLFGGTKGFNIFYPAAIKDNPHIPSIVFTDFQVFNKSVAVGEAYSKHVLLTKAISETNKITLRHNENVFSIEFAALSFTNTVKNKYAYMLEGFNRDWLITDGKVRAATYTNLDPGEYVFRVKASNDDGIWNEQGIALKIVVLPPFWRTRLAYLLYVLLVAALLYFARRLVIQRARMRFALEQERREAQRMHELDMMKIRFFTNMSHELRTPISLILAPVDKLLKDPRPGEKKHYELIKRNARRLLSLVNQLLDFRKLEVNELKLQTSEGDLARFIKEVSFSFTDLAESKNISFSFHADLDSFYTRFDHDKVERILFNLLSNAFKFTPEQGEISVGLQKISRSGNEYLIEITVKDTGIGIPADKQEKIFERFFQNDIPNTVLNQGSGIGLAITKEFVKMHEGTITVQSEPDAGSCFTVLLPFKELEPPSGQPVTEYPAVEDKGDDGVEPAEYAADEAALASPLVDSNGVKNPVILVVEDNDDFRFYLKDNLRAHFNIIEAANGKEGWQKVLAQHPNLVVSDINMPVMDGIELCKKIKEDERTKQLPVILLTAFSGEDQQLRGLGIGATDYMTKPFNFEILLSKLRNLLQYQATIKKTYQKQVQVSPAAIEIESPDDDFVKKVLLSIENNMDNTDFSVEELSQQLCISRGSMYKKLFVLTGKSPIEFIRHVRLKRAAVLLEKSQLTIAEIAYKVGFNNPKYFARYFKAEFGMLPSAYRTEAINKREANHEKEEKK